MSGVRRPRFGGNSSTIGQFFFNMPMFQHLMWSWGRMTSARPPFNTIPLPGFKSTDGIISSDPLYISTTFLSLLFSKSSQARLVFYLKTSHRLNSVILGKSAQLLLLMLITRVSSACYLSCPLCRRLMVAGPLPNEFVFRSVPPRGRTRCHRIWPFD